MANFEVEDFGCAIFLPTKNQIKRLAGRPFTRRINVGISVALLKTHKVEQTPNVANMC